MRSDVVWVMSVHETTLGHVLQECGGSIKTGPFGTKLAASEYSTEGTPVISVGEVGYGALRVSAKTKRVPNEVVARMPEYLLEPGDVVFGRKGAVDRSAWIREDERGYFLGSDGIRLRFGPGVDSRFMAYQLQSRRVRYWILQHAVGTTLASLNEPTLKSVPLSMPSLTQQRAIVATLGALDDKIESNQRIVKAVPALIRAKVTEALLLGAVSTPVSALARFVNGGAYTKGASGTGRMVIRIAELNSGPGGSTVYSGIEVPEEKTATAGDILMSWSGSLGVYRWFRDEAVINQHIFKVIPSGFPAWLIFDRLDAIMPVFRGLAADKATTMGHIQRGHLASVEVDVPEQSVLSKLSPGLTSLWERLLLAEREVLALEGLRDALLPELLAGRIVASPESVE